MSDVARARGACRGRRGVVAMLAVASLAAAASGCAPVGTPPLDAAESAQRLQARRLDSPPLLDFIRASGAQPPGPGEPWDLDRLTLAAWFQDPDLAAARARAAGARASEDLAALRPPASASLGLARNTTLTTPSPWTIGVAIEWLLDPAGRRRAGLDVAAADIAAARAELASAAWAVRARLRAALQALAAAQARQRVAALAASTQDRLAALYAHRRAEGLATALEAGREEAARIRSDDEARTAAAAVDAARRGLAASLRMPAIALEGVALSTAPFDAEPPQAGTAEAPDDARREALTRRADLRAALAAYDAAAAAERGAAAAAWPAVRLAPGFTYDQGQDKWTLGIGFDLPIPGRAEAERARASAAREEAAQRVLALQARILAELDEAQGRAAEAARRRRAAAAELEAATRQQQRAERLAAEGELDRPARLAAGIERLAADAAMVEADQQAWAAIGAMEDALQLPRIGPARPSLAVVTGEMR